jgi:putative exosortase-associated protein (TIGR04073 family)
MRNQLSLLGVVLFAGVLVSGCAGPEKKLGRGVSNIFEIVRMGEMRRSMEQSTLFGPSNASGMVTGFTRSMARVGLGVYETVTFPIPSYDPIATGYLKPAPVYPDNFKPRIPANGLYATDTSIGFSGGDVAPLMPGCRFRIFDN